MIFNGLINVLVYLFNFKSKISAGGDFPIKIGGGDSLLFNSGVQLSWS